MSPERSSPDLPGFLAAGADQRVVSVHTRLLGRRLHPGGAVPPAVRRPAQHLPAGVGRGRRVVALLLRRGVRGGHPHRAGRARRTGSGTDARSPACPPTATRCRCWPRPSSCCTPRAEADLPPLVSGMVGYLGYDVVRRLERLPDANPDDLGIPELAADARRATWPCSTTTPARSGWWPTRSTSTTPPSGSTTRTPTRAPGSRRWPQPCSRPRRRWSRSGTPGPADSEVRRQRTPEEYQAAVAAAIEEIKAGEAFQIVPSQRFETDCPADALDVYRVLRRRNPSPYLYLLRLDGFAIVGSSPEALVQVSGGRATTHPIAGTRPRGATAAADAALEAELLADPEGGGRAPDAGRPRTQRPRPGLPARARWR